MVPLAQHGINQSAINHTVYPGYQSAVTYAWSVADDASQPRDYTNQTETSLAKMLLFGYELNAFGLAPMLKIIPRSCYSNTSNSKPHD